MAYFSPGATRGLGCLKYWDSTLPCHDWSSAGTQALTPRAKSPPSTLLAKGNSSHCMSLAAVSASLAHAGTAL
jgi:hypothetical protein